MSSSAAMSIRKSGPRVIRPPSYQSVVTQTSNRSIWRCARNGQGGKTERILQRSDKYQRCPPYNQRKPETCRDRNATTPKDTYSSWSWAACLSQSSFSDLPAGRERRIWDSDSGQTHKDMEFLKRYIEADPYKAVFGRRLDPFSNFDKNETSFDGFLQSITSMEKPRSVRTKVDKRQTRSDANHVGLQYDPISGRMVPIPQPTTLESSKPEAENNYHKAIDCPSGTEVDAKFAHNPSVTEDGRFQHGNTGPSPEAQSSSQSSSQSTIDCSPGSELDILFTSTPTSQDVQDRLQVPRETKRKPFIITDHPSGSESETLSVSESVPSAQPQQDTSKVNGNTDKPNLDVSLTASTNVECPPGSELEATLISDPTSRFVQGSLSGLETQALNKQTEISIDCPPGNEVDPILSSELGSLGVKSTGPVRQTADTAAMSGAQESFEYSPGSETEAKILSDSASQGIAQLKAQTSVYCPPGSEIDVEFTCNTESIKENQSQPEPLIGLDTSKIANNVVDCIPGNELEAKKISGMGPNENEDLSGLEASNIRSRYARLESKVQANLLDFDTSEDRVSDFIFESQDLATEKGEQPAASQAPSPKFHILAFDTSTSQVSAAQADSFFGIDDDSQPIEILSRLHNPAKFLPYLEKMQEDGYEIATGGGNILVFRKTQITPCHTLSNTSTDEEPAIHAEIAQHLCHDSINSAATYAGTPWQSTSEPPSATRSSSSASEPTTKSESSFRKTGRRMLITSTATAATCYAIGVMTEFFRTGGNDGRGVDGFTVFESDRRRRE
ncbi:hypothetical protein LT330_010029 [Penicillium expansum]|nr:hypothetical protein LT330_010029 [Penicillium expansum]